MRTICYNKPVRQLIINIPVKDPIVSKSFYESIGFELNAALTDEYATCFNISENTIIALLTAGHFKDAINNNEMVDATKSNEVLLSIGVESKQEVDSFAAKAIKAGGKEIGKPTDFGSIYGCTFTDLDGHQWNIYYMAPKL